MNGSCALFSVTFSVPKALRRIDLWGTGVLLIIHFAIGVCAEYHPYHTRVRESGLLRP